MQLILMMLLLLTSCATDPYPDGMDGLDPLDNCIAPVMIGTVENPRKFHEGCTRNLGEPSCATRVEYFPERRHYNVVCKRLSNYQVEIEE